MLHTRTLLVLLCIFVLLFANAYAGGHQDGGSSSSSSSSSMNSCSSSSTEEVSSSSTATQSQGESSSTGVVEESSSTAPASSSSSSSNSCSQSQSSSSSSSSNSCSQSQSSSSSSSECSSESSSSSTGSQGQGESSSTGVVESSSTAVESSSSCPSSSSSSSSNSCSQSQSSSSSSECSSSSSSSSSECSSSSSQSSSSECSSESSSSSTGSQGQGESSSTGIVESSSTAVESSSSCPSMSSSQPQSSSSSSSNSCSQSQSSSSSSSSECSSSSSSSSSECSSSSSSQSSSSSCMSSESSSTGSQGQGESSSTGIVESSTAEESQDCGRGTYSSTGFKPCSPCPNNTYANLRETECTPCPDHTHIPEGTLQDSLTRCVCDDGYSSLWASGGPCYVTGTVPSYQYCGQRTFSETGNAPCEACPNNTYANYAETTCHSCPDHSHILGGGVGISITECVCDDGYTSLWATGGPCYLIGTEQSSSTGEQGQGESSSSGVVESSTGSSGNECSAYTDELSCKRDSACQPIYAHMCSCGKWQFAGCESADYCDNSAQTGTCAVDSDGDRAWFPTRALPSGWTSTTVNKKCGSCCHPDHQSHPGQPSTNVGTGCDFVNGSACVLIEFRGSCPASNVLNEWRINIIEAVATIVSEQLNVTRAAATIGLTVAAIPQTCGGNTICAVHLQIYPPTVGDLSATDFLEAIWKQLGGDSLISGNQVAGIAGVRTYGDLAGIDDTNNNGNTATSGVMAQASVGLMAVATSVIATIW